MKFARIACLFCATLAFGADAPWPTTNWSVSTPEEQGMNSAFLDAGDRWVRSSSPNRFSFLVIRNGYLVYEKYYNGRTADSKDHVASISKSFLSALTGIAIDKGLTALDDRWFDAFPEYAATPRDPRTTDLRTRHMLTMSLGLDWDDQHILDWMMDFDGVQYPDWLRYVLQQPFQNPPGAAFLYNTGNTHLISAFLTRRTGTTTRDFAALYLLNPIGVRDFDWWREYTGQQYYTGGWGMILAPRDVARFGYLYLHDGAWDGRQIVPTAWVRASTSPQIRSGPAPDDFYGYLWWMGNWGGFFVPEAIGMGGQHIWISRELNLVVVTTSDIYNANNEEWRLLANYVLPSVYSAPPSIAAAVNGASGGAAIGPDSFVAIYGDHLAPAVFGWDSVILDGKTLPSALGGVSVTIGSHPCYLSYAGPTQVNVLTPPDLPAGPAEVVVYSAAGMLARSTVTVKSAAPALFSVATFANELVFVGAPGSIPGVTTRPMRRGDNLVLYGNALGATAGTPAAGEVLDRYYPHSDPASVRVSFNNVEVAPQAVTLIYAGLWQVNVQVPEVAAGDVPVRISVAGDASPAIPLRAAP